MKKINEIFYSLQGEGHNTGTPAIFIRFAGCNLHCSFCDTDNDHGTLMTDEDICKEVCRYPARLVIATGGEPGLSIDDTLIYMLHNGGKKVAIETNGTQTLSDTVDWVTVSPKDLYIQEAKIVLKKADEVKVVFTKSNLDYDRYLTDIKADYYYLQPCDTGDNEQNAVIVAETVKYIKLHPLWNLSLQMHKDINIP